MWTWQNMLEGWADVGDSRDGPVTPSASSSSPVPPSRPVVPPYTWGQNPPAIISVPQWPGQPGGAPLTPLARRQSSTTPPLPCRCPPHHGLRYEF